MIHSTRFSDSSVVRRAVPVTILAGLLLVALVSCGRDDRKASGPGAGGPAVSAQAAPATTVGVIRVESGPVPIATELPGRVEAWRVAEVRARAAGIVQKRLFEEGSQVKESQVLYRIDPAPLQSAFANAQAVTRRAQAALSSAQEKEARFRPLLAAKMVSEQAFADIVAARELAQADLAAARAAQRAASLNLSYAQVTAPISGRAGRSLVTEGALVGQGESTPLTTLQQLDPIYVNLSQSSAEYLRLRKALAEGRLERPDEIEVRLVLEDGTQYPERGRLLFTDVTIEPGTSSVALRASFPNPQRLLLPGMYVRAHLAEALDAKAWRVPQQAVIRREGAASVFVAAADDTVAVKPVKTTGTTGTDWIVTEGLADGDRVIVDGLQKIGPGAKVKPVPWAPPQTPVPSARTPAGVASR
ncbi:MAG: efflux RND transporter periplasmic adaptor subunit [Betaproteobacteria bacterium]|nr:efflux RND transporter periplasmic adaptor subunit [Betaproteobacteria bacterium]